MKASKVILIALDMTRADHIGCYGYPRPTSPNLDALAEQGTRFANCTSSFCCTNPSFTAMLTGKLPLNTGVVINPWREPNTRRFQLDDTTRTVAERCWDAGILTAAVDNLINFAGHPNWFARGYEYYMNASRGSGIIAHHTRSPAINSLLLPWLREHADRDFFLFVHYWDPHGPWTQPEEWNQPFREMDLPRKTNAAGEDHVIGAGPARAVDEQARENMDLYDGAIAFVDAAVGEALALLEELGIAEETAVIVTSDHGRTDYGRPESWRARGVHQGEMHVPLIMRVPGLDQQSVSEFLAHGTDLVPTVLELLGVQGDDSLDGVSLLPALTGEGPPREMVSACGHYCGVPQRLLRTRRWKLIRSYADATADLASFYSENGRHKMLTGYPRYELYDMETDPEETVNLADDQPEVVAEMLEKLEAWKRENADDPDAPDPIIEAARWGIQRDPSLIN